MLKSITLRNFKSFGEEQTIPLEPITVLVGPNNSGKSNFMSVGRFMRNAERSELREAIVLEGGRDNLVYRPRRGDESTVIAWTSEDGLSEKVEILPPEQGKNAPYAMRDVKVNPFASSSSIHLRVDALREDAPVGADTVLASDGRGLAAVVSNWRGADLKRAKRLDDYVSARLKEIEHVLVRPAPKPGHARLLVQQGDGELFEASQLSDGVMYVLGLTVHMISAEAGQILFIEEPETGVHPRRLGEIVDLLRAVAYEGRQIIVSTHSPTLLNEFRREPESVVLFRRGDNGTSVCRLADMPDLVAALQLQDARPGDFLANGLFNESF